MSAFSSTNWDANCAVSAPTGLHAVPSPIQRNYIAGRFDRLYQASVAAPISSLFGSGSPSHIARFVVAVIVYSIYRVVGAGPKAHVFVKFVERSEPKLYASSPVARVLVVFWVSASSPSGGVDVVLRRIAHAVGSLTIGGIIPRQAPARLSMAGKMTAWNHGSVPAVAKTAPETTTISSPCEFLRDEPAVPYPGSVNKSAVSRNFGRIKYNIFSHAASLIGQLVRCPGVFPHVRDFAILQDYK